MQTLTIVTIVQSWLQVASGIQYKALNIGSSEILTSSVQVD